MNCSTFLNIKCCNTSEPLLNHNEPPQIKYPLEKMFTNFFIPFNSIGQSLKHFSIVPIELVNKQSKNIRVKREFYYQLRLGTIFPKG